MVSTQNSTSQFVRYFNTASQPLMSLALVLPLILAYEAGLLLLGPAAMRNGADAWLRQFLQQGGFTQYFLLPALTCGLLLAWHHVTRERWQIAWRLLPGMVLEAVLFGVLLLLIAHLYASVFRVLAPVAAMAAEAGPGRLGRILGYCGAGVYEELLFRMILLPAIVMLCRWMKLSQPASLLIGVLASSLLFSAAHYEMFVSRGDPFQWFSFLFRLLAGVYFAVLFLVRGFGIAAAAHAFYDILAGW